MTAREMSKDVEFTEQNKPIYVGSSIPGTIGGGTVIPIFLMQ